jgi:hypothetical protein
MSGIQLAANFTLNTALPLDDRQVFADLAARDALDPLRRHEGLKVYVTSEQKYYSLVGGIANVNWVEDTGGGGGGALTVISSEATPSDLVEGPVPSASGSKLLAFAQVGDPVSYAPPAPDDAANQFGRITYAPEIDTLVALGYDIDTQRKLQYSLDGGDTWQLATHPALGELSCSNIVWAPALGIFCFINSQTPLTSPDGITWTAHTPIAENIADAATDFSQMAWSEPLGLFICAVGPLSSQYVRSTNGTSWTVSTVNGAGIGNTRACVWAGAPISKFFISGTSGARMAESADGITWADVAAAPTGSVRAMFWFPTIGKIVGMINDTTARIVNSSDGVTWASVSMVTSSAPSYVIMPRIHPTYGIVVGAFSAASALLGAANRIATSSNGGASFTYRTPPMGNAAFSGLEYHVSSGRIISNNETTTGDRVSYTTDFSVWTFPVPLQTIFKPVVGLPLYRWKAITSGPNGDTLVASEDETAVIRDSDSVDLYPYTPPASSTINSVAWIPELSLYVMCRGGGAATTHLATSPDGDIWTDRTSPVNRPAVRVAWSPSLSLLVVALGGTAGTNSVITSPTGVTWTARTTISSSLGDVIWVAELGRFIAVGSGTGAIQTSTNGTTWANATSYPAGVYRGVLWNPRLKKLFAFGNGGGNLLESSDGLTWTTLIAVPAEYRHFTFCDKLGYMAAFRPSATTAVQDAMITSADGVSVVSRASVANTFVTGATWNSERNMLFLCNGLLGGGQVVRADYNLYLDPGTSLYQELEVGGSASDAFHTPIVVKSYSTKSNAAADLSGREDAIPLANGVSFGYRWLGAIWRRIYGTI